MRDRKVKYKFQAVKQKLQIIDDALSEEDFAVIEDMCFSPPAMRQEETFPYYLETNVTGHADGSDGTIYFCHVIQYDCPPLYPVLDLLNIGRDGTGLHRIKVNLYPGTPEIHHHADHVDAEIPHKGAILYLNTNNGLTVVDGVEVESVRNRLLLFDPTIPHHSTTCSDKPFRANINFNYQ